MSSPRRPNEASKYSGNTGLKTKEMKRDLGFRLFYLANMYSLHLGTYAS